MKFKRNHVAAGLLACGAVVAAVPPAQAQELAEIMVTARRQGEESLMATPLAITAFDTETIENRDITNLQDVANLTPGLSFFNPLGENLPTPVIRGIVPQDIFGKNAAAIFVDGIFVAGREAVNFSQLDIERIEVLKGPQSAAYGRNAFSGAINYVTRAPSEVFESRFEGEVGNRGRQKVTGQVSGPILGDLLDHTLTGRLALLYDEWDGSYDNTLAPQNDIGGYRFRTYLGKLRWQPTDKLEFNLGFNRSNDEIDPAAMGGVLANCEDEIEQTSKNQSEGPGVRYLNWCGRIPKLEDLPGMLDGSQFPNPGLIPGSVRRDAMPKNALATGEDRDVMRTHFTIDWDSAYGTLSSLTGFSHVEQNDTSDFERTSGDTVPFAYCYPSSNFDPPACNPPLTWSRAPMGFIDIEYGPVYEEWSQEIRFTSPREQRLRWQAGGYYFHLLQEQHQGGLVATTQLPGDIGPGGNIAVGPVALPTSLAIGSYVFGRSLGPDGGLDPLNRIRNQYSEKSWSLFASSDFDITDRLTARAEIRHTQHYKSALAYNYTPCLSPIPGSSYPVSTTIPVADCGNTFWDLRDVSPVGYLQWVEDENGVYQQVAIPGVESGRARFDSTTGRLGLQYTLDSGWMAYGSVAYGEKPGDVNVVAVDAAGPGGSVRPAAVFNAVEPEKITTYEVGLKGYTPDRRIRVDMAMFFNDWRDIVLRQLIDHDPVTGLQFVRPEGLAVNAGDTHIFGWEITTDIGITDNLSGRVTAAFTNSRLKNARQDTYVLFPSFYTTDPTCSPAAIQGLPVADQDAKAEQCGALSGDVAGNTQMRQPEWTASASLDYRHPLRGDWELKSGISASYTGKMYMGNDNQNWTPPRTNVNFNIGLESARYTVRFWVRNLLDNDDPLAAYRDIYWTNDADMLAQTPIAGHTIRDVSTFDDFPPIRMSINYPSLRTYGVTAKVRFGGAGE